MREKLLTFCQKNFDRSDKTWFYVSKRTNWIKKGALENVQFSKHVRNFNEKNPAFFPKKFSGFVKTVFIISVGTFWRKKRSRKKMYFFYLLYCSDIESKLFGLVPKKLQWGCQNCKLRVCGTSVQKGIFLKKYGLFIKFWLRAKKCQLFVE